MSDPQFLTQATATVQSVLSQLEAQDKAGILELDDNPDGLTIEFESGRQLVISIHRASGELWLASSRLGGLHFRFYREAPRWRLSDGREFYSLLQDDVRALSEHAHWQLTEEAA